MQNKCHEVPTGLILRMMKDPTKTRIELQGIRSAENIMCLETRMMTIFPKLSFPLFSPILSILNCIFPIAQHAKFLS